MVKTSSLVRNTVRDMLLSSAMPDVRLLGQVGASADACIRARIYSDWARGAMYEECVNSFRTHWDDAPDGGNGWGWQNEYWGKTMLCVAGAIAYTGDKALAEWAIEKAHAFVREFQKPNGYLSTYAKEDFLRSNPESDDARSQACFNVWGRKYTLWALVELHKATDDADCLAAAVKMADHLIAQLSRLGLTLAKTGAWHGISSMSILRPMLELYRITGTERYRTLADEIVRDLSSESGGPEAILRDARREDRIADWYPIPTFWAKAYETMSCLEGLADYYRLTGRKEILDGIIAYHGHLVREELNPMCGVGHFDHFVNAAARVNGMTELCDVTHWIRLNRELLLLTGDARYADLIEEAFLNAFLAGVFRDGRWGAHIVRSHGTRHLPAPAQTGMVHHQCCPDNMMRTFFDYAASQVARMPGGALAVILYTDGTATLGADRVEVSGGYPWSDGPIVVKATLAADGPIRFRVPRWSATIDIDGRAMEPRDGWVEVVGRAGENSWSLRLDMSPRLANWNARAHDEVPDYTVTYMEWCTPDMVGLSRVEPAMRAFRGPLVLAKGRLAGTSRDETLFAMTRRAQGWRASLRPAPRNAVNAGVVQPWMLTFERAGETYDIPVADFASVSNIDDPSNWFSLWF